jgi:hypothetical protein
MISAKLGLETSEDVVIASLAARWNGASQKSLDDAYDEFVYGGGFQGPYLGFTWGPGSINTTGMQSQYIPEHNNHQTLNISTTATTMFNCYKCSDTVEGVDGRCEFCGNAVFESVSDNITQRSEKEPGEQKLQILEMVTNAFDSGLFRVDTLPPTRKMSLDLCRQIDDEELKALFERKKNHSMHDTHKIVVATTVFLASEFCQVQKEVDVFRDYVSPRHIFECLNLKVSSSPISEVISEISQKLKPLRDVYFTLVRSHQWKYLDRDRIYRTFAERAPFAFNVFIEKVSKIHADTKVNELLRLSNSNSREEFWTKTDKTTEDLMLWFRNVFVNEKMINKRPKTGSFNTVSSNCLMIENDPHKYAVFNVDDNTIELFHIDTGELIRLDRKGYAYIIDDDIFEDIPISEDHDKVKRKASKQVKQKTPVQSEAKSNLMDSETLTKTLEAYLKQNEHKNAVTISDIMTHVKEVANQFKVSCPNKNQVAQYMRTKFGKQWILSVNTHAFQFITPAVV